MSSLHKPLRVAVIGIGFGQHVHVPAWRTDDRCEVVAVAASTLERARAVAERLSVPAAYGHWREMLEKERLHAVSIALPPHLQPHVAQACAERGVAIFCEKPAASTVKDAQQMLTTAQDARVGHAINFMFPEIPAWRAARDLLRAGAIGEPRHAALAWRVETYAVRHNTQGWKQRAESGGGTLNNFVSHAVYYLQWLLGPVASVQARLEPAAPCDDVRVGAWVGFASGVMLNLAVAADCPHGSGHRLEVYGSDGALILHNDTSDYVRGFELAMGTRADTALQARPVLDNLTETATDGRIAATASIMRRLVDHLQGCALPTPNLADGLAVQRVLERFRASASAGTRLDVGAA